MNFKRDNGNYSKISCKIKYWTANERHCQVPDATISAFSYHEKSSKKTDCSRKAQDQFYNAKRKFVESRREVWMLPSKRTDRLADCVRELNSILSSNAILHVRWAKPHKIQLIFNTGLLVNILLTPQNDIQRIFFDKSLTVKLPPEAGSITAATISDKFCILCYDEGNKIAYVSFMQRPETPELKRMTSKISSMDMKISFHDIPGDPNQRGCRKFCLNSSEDIAVCWSSSHLTSSPSSRAERQTRVNMVLLNCSFGKLEVLSFIHTDSNPVHVQFSKINQHQLGSLERTVTSRSEVALQYVTYECTNGRLQRLDINLIPVKSGVLSCSRNNDESKLAIGCTDGTIVIYDMFTKLSRTLRDHMVPSIVSWHPDGGVMMVASGSAELKCYDCGLGEIAVSSLDDHVEALLGDTFKLSQFLPGDNGLVNFLWPTKTMVLPGASRSALSTPVQYDTALVLFDGGPFALLNFRLGLNSKGLLRPIDIIREHIVNDNLKLAIEVLHSINWSRDPDDAFLAMITIFNHLLKKPLSFDTEEMLERTLGSFYAPQHPIAEAIIIEHRHSLSRYARRFFHHLLEFGRLEKAFLLAKDIQDRDLFVDIYFNAKRCGETIVAKAAKQKMIELYSSSEEGSSSESEFLNRKEHDRAMRKRRIKRKLSANIMKRKSNVTSPRIRKEIVPSSYPPPKMDDFMKSLISETKALEMNGDHTNDADEILPKNVIQTGSTLKILDYGYV